MYISFLSRSFLGSSSILVLLSFCCKKNSDNGIEEFLVGCIPSIIDEKISTLSKVATSTKQDPLGFIGGLSLSHQYKLVGQTLKKNSF